MGHLPAKGPYCPVKFHNKFYIRSLSFMTFQSFYSTYVSPFILDSAPTLLPGVECGISRECLFQCHIFYKPQLFPRLLKPKLKNESAQETMSEN